nr:type 1 glutamine amidotransferase [Corynebacterium mendelii]
MPQDADALTELARAVGTGTGGVDGLVVCGGRMSALACDEHPWLEDLGRLLRAVIAEEIPVFGMCLGLQILAHTFGGEVRVGDDTAGHDGPLTVTLERPALADPVFGALARLGTTVTVYESHNDHVSVVPAGAVVLASSTNCPVEALRYGSAVGTQFHPEASPDEAARWAESEYGPGAAGPARREAEEADPAIAAVGRALCRGFFDQVTARRSTG